MGGGGQKSPSAHSHSRVTPKFYPIVLGGGSLSVMSFTNHHYSQILNGMESPKVMSNRLSSSVSMEPTVTYL